MAQKSNVVRQEILPIPDEPVTNTDGQTRGQLITINSSRIRILQDSWQQRWNRLPNQAELQQLVDAWIHEEVLFRESLNRGMDRNDELVRRRLIQKIEVWFAR